jgi:hypothetical protein
MSKKQLNEWNDESFKKLPKRWSKNYNKPDGTGLTEFEKLGGKDIPKKKTKKNPKGFKW